MGVNSCFGNRDAMFSSRPLVYVHSVKADRDVSDKLCHYPVHADVNKTVKVVVRVVCGKILRERRFT